MLVLIFFLWYPVGTWLILAEYHQEVFIKKKSGGLYIVHMPSGQGFPEINITNESKGGQEANITDPLKACCMLVCMDLCRKTIASYHRIMDLCSKSKLPPSSQCAWSQESSEFSQKVITSGFHYENLPETLMQVSWDSNNCPTLITSYYIANHHNETGTQWKSVTCPYTIHPSWCNIDGWWCTLTALSLSASNTTYWT